MKVFRVKKFLIEELIPPLMIIIHYFAYFGVLFLLPIIIYSCICWKGYIFLWTAYYLWIYYDSHTLKTEGRKLHWLKRLPIFNCLRSYYPLRLVKLAEIPADRNYIFACFPHALFPQGALWNFSTDVNNASALFPELDFRILSLEFYFMCPIVREYFMAMGYGTTDKANMKYLLNSKTPKALVLFPGGNKEASYSSLGDTITIVKNNRKGFVRIALETGTPLVPVFSFGENNIFDQLKIESKIINYLIAKLYKYTNVKLLIIKGTGFGQRTSGILPNRCPINTVVGEPIFVPHVDDPPDALVDEYHEKFYQALYHIFENNKRTYDKGGIAAKLVMI